MCFEIVALNSSGNTESQFLYSNTESFAPSQHAEPRHWVGTLDNVKTVVIQRRPTTVVAIGTVQNALLQLGTKTI